MDVESLKLVDFAPIIQLAATINLAYIAVEYAKSYTGAIARNVFRFGDIIKNHLVRCESHIDKQTICSLKPCTVDGGDTLIQIQKVQRESSKLLTEVNETQIKLESLVADQCNSKSFASISLYLFLFSTLYLFCCGISYSNIVKWTLVFTFAISFLYLLASFIWGESKSYAKHFASMKTCIVTFLITILFSMAAAYFIDKNFGYVPVNIWNASLLASSIIPFVNFVVFVLKIKLKSKQIMEEIGNKIKILEEKCKQLEKEVNELKSVQSVSLRLSKENMATIPFSRQSTQRVNGRVKKPSRTQKPQK